jgi:hypothetical protein
MVVISIRLPGKPFQRDARRVDGQEVSWKRAGKSTSGVPIHALEGFFTHFLSADADGFVHG